MVDYCDNCKQPTTLVGNLFEVSTFNTIRSEVEGWFCAVCINEFEREGKIEAET